MKNIFLMSFLILFICSNVFGVYIPYNDGDIPTGQEFRENWEHAFNGQAVYDVDTGIDDDYEITLTPIPLAYQAGMKFRIKVTTGNTGAASLNVNALGIKTIIKNQNTTLQTGDIIANQVIYVVFDGTNFILLNPAFGSQQVSVSSDDLTKGFLNGKLVAGTNIDLDELGGGGNETLQVRLNVDSNLLPSTDAVTDLGSSSLQWKDVYIQNILKANGVDISVADLVTVTDGSDADAQHNHPSILELIGAERVKVFVAVNNNADNTIASITRNITGSTVIVIGFVKINLGIGAAPDGGTSLKLKIGGVTVDTDIATSSAGGPGNTTSQQAQFLYVDTSSSGNTIYQITASGSNTSTYNHETSLMIVEF